MEGDPSLCDSCGNRDPVVLFALRRRLSGVGSELQSSDQLLSDNAVEMSTDSRVQALEVAATALLGRTAIIESLPGHEWAMTRYSMPLWGPLVRRSRRQPHPRRAMGLITGCDLTGNELTLQMPQPLGLFHWGPPFLKATPLGPEGEHAVVVHLLRADARTCGA